MDAIGTNHNELQSLENVEKKSTFEFDIIKDQYSGLLQSYNCAADILKMRNLLSQKRNEHYSLQNKYDQIQREQENLTAELKDQELRIQKAAFLDPLRIELSKLPTKHKQASMINFISDEISEKKELYSRMQSEYASAQILLDEILASGTIVRLLKRFPKPEIQKAKAQECLAQLTIIDAEINSSQKALVLEKAKLNRIVEIERELSGHENIGTHQVELNSMSRIDNRIKEILAHKVLLNSSLSELLNDIQQFETEEIVLSKLISGDAEFIYNKTLKELTRYKELEDQVKSLKGKIVAIRADINRKLDYVLSRLKQITLINYVQDTFEQKYAAVIQIINEADSEYRDIHRDDLQNKIDRAKKEIFNLAVELTEVEKKLAAVEREVIAKASVVGATLTKVYLSDDIHNRKFDTVILDEASMAPIPALWVAALLATNNLIIVGDFKQLPPIVLSTNESTKKWLGRDIFEVSGLKEQYHKNNAPDYFIPLFEQRRMLPQISQVANIFYDKRLVDAYKRPEDYPDFKSFSDWYVNPWGDGSAVVLIDTGPLNAWVTSVVKNGNSSRLNFLSATVSVDIAEQLLSNNITKRAEGASKRILIVSPYRAHAKLINLLIKDVESLEGEVVAGTAHSFQGSEADVVIFDLVVDEPHFRVNLFMPMLDEQLKCLLNVALTRAKFRLFILGDFNYCSKNGRKAFLGRELLPFLIKNFPMHDARDVVPAGLAARAAKSQMTMLGGNINPNTERIVVTQIDFFRLLSTDLGNSNFRIVIYSPFITESRISFLLPQLQAAIEKNVKVYIITKSLSERTKTEIPTIRRIENLLSSLGIIIIHKMRMHEKFVFVDNDITWSGSLNPLSFSNTQEIMERRKCSSILEDYFKILRLDEMLSVKGRREGECPICNSEMIAAEGADQPYYWRCVNDECFSRGIDQPYPADGILTCQNCASPVEFGYWGNDPHWRCTMNNRHRQKIFKSHLRLPKMAKLVPQKDRAKLCKIFNIEDFEKYIYNSTQKKPQTSQQLTLLD